MRALHAHAQNAIQICFSLAHLIANWSKSLDQRSDEPVEPRQARCFTRMMLRQGDRSKIPVQIKLKIRVKEKDQQNKIK